PSVLRRFPRQVGARHAPDTLLMRTPYYRTRASRLRHTELLSLAHGLPALPVNETQRGTHGWPNLVVHDKVRELVLLGRFTIENRESCARPLGEQRKPRCRIDDKRRTENQKEIAATRHLIGAGHFVL